nr:hypothetical protein [Kibdelosporangium sp. MJ126-NF4]CTQ94917.1 hypothetical protein [Kibdelosporangium sp. MJ126-NF4]
MRRSIPNTSASSYMVGTGLVVGDQPLEVVVTELPGASRAVPFDRCRLGCVDAGELLIERL